MKQSSFLPIILNMFTSNSHQSVLLIAALLMLNCSNGGGTSTSNPKPVPNPPPQPINLADPTILKVKDVYYLYGTNDRNTNLGFPVYTSSDLKNWVGPKGIKNGMALSLGDTYGTRDFWAPQVFYHHSKFYMFYTANEHIAMASSASPLGPFINQNNSVISSNKKIIDPYVFIDDDKAYLYYVRLDNGNKIYVAQLNDDFNNIKPKTTMLCIEATDSWENTLNVKWTVVEGASVFKHNNLYYLIYSANDFRNPNYAVGYATSISPLGPWNKYENNPILSKNDIGINGSGHGDFFKDNSGQLYYVFHTHYSNSLPLPRKTALVKLNFETQDGKPDKIVVKSVTYKQLQAKKK